MDCESALYAFLRREKNGNAARTQTLAFERPDDRRGREISSPASKRVFLPLNIYIYFFFPRLWYWTKFTRACRVFLSVDLYAHTWFCLAILSFSRARRDPYIDTDTLSRQRELLFIYSRHPRDINLFCFAMRVAQNYYVRSTGFPAEIDVGCQREKWDENCWLEMNMRQDWWDSDCQTNVFVNSTFSFRSFLFTSSCLNARISMYSESKKQMELTALRDYNMYLHIFIRDFLVKLCHSFDNIIDFDWKVFLTINN